MADADRHPLAICLSKDGPNRFLGHLDFARLVERSLRRSGLPVQRTRGFNPRFRLSFSEALPVGVASEGEWIGLALDEDLRVEDVRDRLAKALPEGVRLVEVRRSDLPAADGPQRYRLDVSCHPGSATDALTALLQCDQFPVEDARTGRPIDARAHLAAGEAAGGHLILDLVPANGRPPRPGPLVQALRALARQAGAPEPEFGACTKLGAAARPEGGRTWDDAVVVVKDAAAQPQAASC